MRILVVTPYFYPHAGGTERYITELYTELMRQDRTIKVDVLTYNTNQAKKVETWKNLTIYRAGCVEILKDQFALPNYLELGWLARRLKRNNYDVVNAHTRFFDTSWWGWLFAKYFGAKSVLTDHCAYHPNHKSWLVRKIAEGVDHMLIPWLGKVYSRVTVVSKATGEFLKAHGMKREMEVIYGGVKIANYQKIPHEGIRVGYVGRMIATKGPQIVVDAAKELLPKYPKLSFIFAGNGELWPQLKKQANERMRFLGNISHEKVEQLLRTLDILVLPSTHHEGLPSVILEAGAAGCVVVTTDRGGVKEVIEDGKTGLIIKPDLVELTKYLDKLINDHQLREKLGNTLQKEIMVKFDWKIIVNGFYDLLKVTVR